MYFFPHGKGGTNRAGRASSLQGESMNAKQPSELTAFDRNASLLGIQMKL